MYIENRDKGGGIIRTCLREGDKLLFYEGVLEAVREEEGVVFQLFWENEKGRPPKDFPIAEMFGIDSKKEEAVQRLLDWFFPFCFGSFNLRVEEEEPEKAKRVRTFRLVPLV